MQRILYLIKNKNVDPEKILFITFTNKAAKDTKYHLRDHPITIRYNFLLALLIFSTLHSLCFQILRSAKQKYSLASKSKQLAIVQGMFTMCKCFHISKTEQMELLAKQYEGKFFANEIIAESPNDVLNFIHLCKSNSTAQTAPSGWRFQVWQKYEHALQQQEMIDFTSMILLATSLLHENAGLQTAYHEQYQYVFIDELQDLNIAQLQLLKVLCKHNRITAWYVNNIY